MSGLERWMRVVGVLYLLNAAALVMSYVVPSIGEASVAQRVPGATSSDRLYGFAMDTWLMFALEVAVIGAVLLYASRRAWSNRILAVAVIALELVRGIFDDVLWIANGYPAAIYFGWIVFHAVVIGTGVMALKNASSERQQSVLTAR